MQIGIVGLGKMGGNMATRLREGGHEVVGYDRDPAISDVASLKELVERLTAPRAVWLMVPAGEPTRATIELLGGLLAEGDLVVDGGNSHYADDRAHAQELGARGVGFVDVGVSGGVWGLDEGYALMVGGDAEHVRRLMPIFETLKPQGADGFVHAGRVGAGHFAKMVHNGIEYGMMQALAEGWELLEAADVVTDVPGAFRSWRQGTVIRSWLLDLLVRALDEDPDLADLRGYAEDSGEGRWTVQAAVEHAVPLPVITAALYARFASRQDDSPAMRMVAALRNQFGGHAVSSAEGGRTKGADAPGADAAPPPETER
jgi:6-phosphogluconate dehydrogenase